MKQICEVVQDLLWLYEEGECSAGTKRFVEDHLAECKECRTYQTSIKITDQVKESVKKLENETEEKVIRNSFHKIKRRWIASLVAVIMIFPLVGLGILGIHEYKKEGICFSNLQEVTNCIRLVKLLEEEKFEEAAEMLDFYEEDIKGSKEEYEVVKKEDFIHRLLAYQEKGFHLTYRGFDDAFKLEDGWQIEINVIEERENKVYSKLVLFAEGDSIEGYISSTGENELVGEFLGRILQ